MTRRLLIAAFILVAAQLGHEKGWADFSSSARGTTAAGFLKLGVGGRAESLGEAYSAVADDASAMYWNPAAMTRIPPRGGAVTVMHAPYIESSYYDYAALAYNSGAYGAWGASAQYFTPGQITQTDRAGADIGSFTPYDLAGTVGYANQWAGFSLGVTGKFIQSKIIDSASTFAADLGLLSPAYTERRLRFAAVASNIGGRMRFDQDSENLPLTFRGGFSFQMTDHWLWAADGVFPRDNSPYAALGTEYLWPFGDGASLAGRAGYNSRTLGNVDGVTGGTLGVGLNLRRFSVDYAFLPFGSLGLTHRISLTLRWGNTEPREGPSASLRSSRRASSGRRTCAEIYGAENCRGNDWAPVAPTPTPSPAPADRLW